MTGNNIGTSLHPQNIRTCSNMVSYGHLFCFREVNDGPPVPVQEDGLYLQQIWHTLCLVLKLLCILGLLVASFFSRKASFTNAVNLEYSTTLHIIMLN